LLTFALLLTNALSQSYNIQEKLAKEWVVRQFNIDKNQDERIGHSFLHHWAFDKPSTPSSDSSSPSSETVIPGTWRINETSIQITEQTKPIKITINNAENSGTFEYGDESGYDMKKLFDFKFVSVFNENKENIYMSYGKWLGFENAPEGYYEFILGNNYFIININPKNDNDNIIVWSGNLFGENAEPQSWFKKNMTSFIFIALIVFNLFGKMFLGNSRAAAASGGAAAAKETKKKN